MEKYRAVAYKILLLSSILFFIKPTFAVTASVVENGTLGYDCVNSYFKVISTSVRVSSIKSEKDPTVLKVRIDGIPQVVTFLSGESIRFFGGIRSIELFEKDRATYEMPLFLSNHKFPLSNFNFDRILLGAEKNEIRLPRHRPLPRRLVSAPQDDPERLS